MFLKSCSHVQSLLVTSNRPQAYSDFQSMKKKTDADGKIVGYPAIEAVFVAFCIVMECLDRFQASKRPTVHIALPMIYKAMRQLDLVASGEMFGEATE